MATVLRDLSYRYQWLYDSIARLAAFSVGGETRFRQLPLQGLSITADMRILDLCCGSGQTTQFLVAYAHHVTGLDASPRSIRRAQENVPQATFVEGWAESMPLPDQHFDLVHTSAAMHEMATEQRQAIFQEVWRVLKPGGYFVMSDFHAPQNWLFWPGVALFLWLFETATAWQLLREDLVATLTRVGFAVQAQHLHAGGSLQVLQATKPAESVPVE